MAPHPPIPWFQPAMTGGELIRLQDVLDRNFLNDGPLTRQFEERIAAIAGVRHCVAVTSGTVAISLALIAAGIGAGDEVLVPDLTFIATANAVRMTGAEPVLVDVESERFAIDPAKLEAALTPRTRAVVPVDVNGRGADYVFLEDFCRRHDLKLIADAAEALGSAFNGKPLGSFGHAGCFSLSPNKTITTGQGGIVATNDEDIYLRLVELKDQGRPKRGSGGDDEHPAQGYNFKFTDLQAAVGLAQLEVFAERCAQARRRDEWYRTALAGVEGVQLGDMTTQDGEIRQWTDALFERRDVVRRALDQAGIGCRAFWFPLHTQKPYYVEHGDFSGALSVSRHGLWLPSHFSLTESEVARTAEVIRAAVKQV